MSHLKEGVFQIHIYWFTDSPVLLYHLLYLILCKIDRSLAEKSINAVSKNVIDK